MDDPIEGRDFFVRVIDFPSHRLGGAVTPNDDGTYSVYINSRLDSEHQRRACDHEVEHIKDDDLYSEEDISQVENI